MHGSQCHMERKRAVKVKHRDLCLDPIAFPRDDALDRLIRYAIVWGENFALLGFVSHSESYFGDCSAALQASILSIPQATRDTQSRSKQILMSIWALTQATL